MYILYKPLDSEIFLYLYTHEVSDIGRRSASPEMGVVLGIGVIYEYFHKARRMPDENEVLKISATGVASSCLLGKDLPNRVRHIIRSNSF